MTPRASSHLPRCSEMAAVLTRAFFARDSLEVARDLLGVEMRCGVTAGRIVEVEAYDEKDPASHSFRGPTPRARVMFDEPGHLYVYRSYGIHWCANVVCGEVGHGAAVLIRALEPTDGLAEMAARRGRDGRCDLCSGPGKLCSALGIDGRMNGTSLHDGPVRLSPGPAPDVVAVGPRIGISVATEVPWRLGDANSPYLSRSFPMEVTDE